MISTKQLREQLKKESDLRKSTWIIEGSLDDDETHLKTLSPMSTRQLMEKIDYEEIRYKNNIFLFKKRNTENRKVFPCVSPEELIQYGKNWIDILKFHFPEALESEKSFTRSLDLDISGAFFNKSIISNTDLKFKRMSDLPSEQSNLLMRRHYFGTYGQYLSNLKKRMPFINDISNCEIFPMRDMRYPDIEFVCIKRRSGDSFFVLSSSELPLSDQYEMHISKGLSIREEIQSILENKNRLNIEIGKTISRKPIEIIGANNAANDVLLRAISNLYGLEINRSLDKITLRQPYIKSPQNMSEIYQALKASVPLPLLEFTTGENVQFVNSVGKKVSRIPLTMLVGITQKMIELFKSNAFKTRKSIPYAELPFNIQIATAFQLVCQDVDMRSATSKSDLMHFTPDSLFVSTTQREEGGKKFGYILISRPETNIATGQPTGTLGPSYTLKFQLP